MEEFVVRLKHRPGGLERVAQVLNKHGVNIESLASEANGEGAIIKIVTNDAKSTEKALEESNIPFTVNDVLVAKVLHRPGELYKLASKLASANININSIYLLKEGHFALRVDDIKKARSVLKDSLV